MADNVLPGQQVPIATRETGGIHTQKVLTDANAAAAVGGTPIAASITSAVLMAANTARRGGTFYNHSASAYLYLKLGSVASSADFTVRLSPGGYYELPPPVWRGDVAGIWTAAVGYVMPAEYT